MERELFEKILNSLIEGIVVVDSDETIAFINDEALNILGIDGEDAAGAPVRETIPNTRLHIVLKSGEAELNRIQYLKDKTIVTSRFPIVNSNGLVHAAMAVFRDITNVEKMAEEVINHKEMEGLLTSIIDSTYDAISVADEKGEDLSRKQGLHKNHWNEPRVRYWKNGNCGHSGGFLASSGSGEDKEAYI